VIAGWRSNRSSVELLGIWESVFKPDLKIRPAWLGDIN